MKLSSKAWLTTHVALFSAVGLKSAETSASENIEIERGAPEQRLSRAEVVTKQFSNDAEVLSEGRYGHRLTRYRGSVVIRGRTEGLGRIDNALLKADAAMTLKR